MICPGCGAEAAPDFAFCPRCGQKLPRACVSCGTAVAPDFAFCPRCGARQAEAPTLAPAPAPGSQPTTRTDPAPHRDAVAAEADRRLVTVLFADLAGFTTLSERLDPEDVRALQADLFQELAASVTHFEGFVEKFVGDAVMAVFGAPVAHEDDPERALRAALLMQERMDGLNRRWASRLGTPLQLHVGINTGPVVAGNIGSAPGAAYAVTGDTVNTAARLQHAAEPGQVLVSRATYRLTQHAFAFEPLGNLALRGKAEPLPAYRLLGLLVAPRSARGLEAHGLAAPLVGRDPELGQMQAAYDRMRSGQAQVVSLVGEAGAGKSRLLGEFFARLAAAGQLRTTAVRRAACSSLGEQTYGVLAAFLREAFGVASSDPPEAVQRKLVAGLETLGASEAETAAIVSLLGYVLGVESEGRRLRHVEPEQLNRQIVLAARMLFEWRLQFGPLLLVVEDLHWADAASVGLLASLVDHLADRALMLLATQRPALEPGGGIAVSGAIHTTIRVAPLSSDHSEALLAAFFGASASRLPASLRQLIVTRAGGNPFYLEEVVRSLIERGALVREAAGWTCRADAAALDIPLTIQGLLLSRLDRLPPDARRLAQEASVLGPEVDERLLRLVASAPGSAEAGLDALCRAELLAEAPGPSGASGPPAPGEREYRFTHALVQEAVYQNLLVRRRTELHARAGQALETLCQGQPQRLEDLEALGHHWSLGTDKAKGARYLVSAGDWARAIYANDDAVSHYRRALETLRECVACEALTLAVHERLGDLLGPAGQREAALSHHETALGAHEAAGDRPAQARLRRKIGGLHWDAGDRDRALACCQAGLALLDGQAAHIEQAHLYQEMGRLAFRSGDNGRAIEWAEQALAHAEGLAAGGDPDTRREAAAAISQAYNTLGVALARTGQPQAAVGHIEESVKVAEAEGLLHAACRGYTNLGVLYSTLDPGRAIETCRNGLAVAKRIGDLGLQSRLYANLAVAYCALTNRCEAEGLGAAQAAIDLDRRLGQLDHLAIPLIVLGQIYQCHGGDPALALRCYREALELAEAAGEPQLLFPCYDGLATMYLEMGDDARAEQYLLKAQEVCARAGLDPDSLMVLPFLS